MSIKLDVTKSTVKKELAVLPEKMLEYAYEVIMTQAELMKGLWQIKIKVDTGSARDSIRIEHGGKSMGRRSIRVRGGGYVVNPKTGRLVDYMMILEAKYGAGREAFEEVKPTIAEMIKNRVVERVS